MLCSLVQPKMRSSPMTIIYVAILLCSMPITSRGETYNSQCGDSVSITCWNSRGMLTSLPYLNHLMESNDIIAVSEHWLHANRLHELQDISDDFNCISRASRHSGSEFYGVRRGQGGVALFWKKELAGVSPISEITHDRICGLRLQTKSNRIINIFSVYFPTQGSADDLR